MQRVRYYFDGDNLVRRTWKHLDRAPEAGFTDRKILTDVASWKIQFLADNQWLDEWPVEALQHTLPQAIEFRLILRDDTSFRWLFSVKPLMQRREL
jgi:type II secretion system protein J